MVDFVKDFPQPPAGEPSPVADHQARRIRFRGEEPVAIVLLNPLAIENGDAPAIEIDSLTVRRLTAGEMIGIVEALGEGVDDAELVRHVTAAMAGIETDILEALSPDDAGRVATAALPFMPAGLVAAIEQAGIAAGEAADGAV